MPQTPTSDPIASVLKLGDDLLGQLARRRQDDRLRTSRSGFQHLDQRNSEGSRLPRARFGLADDVETFESFGNECRLDGGGRQVADVLESLKHGVAQTHRLEPSSGFLNTLSNQSILQKHSSVNMTRQYHYRRLV